MQSLRIAIPILLLVTVISASTLASTPEILAYVGEDTLTTIDLRIELNLMEKRSQTESRPVLPKPDAVLRRLVQNRLIVQEGYRMGLDEEFTVNNQVTEAVNARCMGALLDSVALAVTVDGPNLKDRRRLAVKNYIENLMVVYNVHVDSTLLQSLDYGSRDTQMQTLLRDNEEILVTVPTGTLTVKSFSRLIRFTAFHGLVDKPDAAERRDRILNEWISEAVTIHAARQMKISDRPVIQMYKLRLERTLMLEETLRILLQTSFEPTDTEVESFYQQKRALFAKPVQVKMESLKFITEEAANEGRKRLDQGAKMNWIKRNMEQVIEGAPPFPLEWFEAAKLDLKPDQIKVGYIPEPYGVPGGWVLARVSDIQELTYIPLAECRDKVLRMMKANATQTQMSDILAQLEAVVEVRIEPDAEMAVARILTELENKQ